MGNILEGLTQHDQQLVLDVIRALKDSKVWGVHRHVRNAIDPEMIAVWWSIDDIEQLATQIEKNVGKVLYNRDEFQFALERLYDKHDCNIGISWEVIEVYLDEYCKIETTE